MSLKRFYQQLKNVYHFFQAHFWRIYCGLPDRGMKIYGVTGTNGKTTTCILLGNILREAYEKEKVGLLTTIVFWIGSKEKVNETKMTTMDSRDVFRYLREMNQAGVKYVVLEVTSHALDQNRLAGIKLDGAIILNIAREHLDYHRTMEEYARAKGKIVDYLHKGALLVVKGDDEWIAKSLDESRIKNNESSVRRFTKQAARQIATPLPGEVNKENALAARLLAGVVGIDEAVIKRGIERVKQVPGRMEWISLSELKQGQVNPSEVELPRVLIDYAVTPDALERLYAGIKRDGRQGRIFGILGACGNRDRGKRPEMARVVAKYADELVLTREDPWMEDEEQIFNDLESGLDAAARTHFSRQLASASGANPVSWRGGSPQSAAERLAAKSGCGQLKGKNTVAWKRIVDRREAIKYCLEKAGPEDVVVVTGKGAETGMAIGNKIIPWSDKVVIQELLEEMVKSR